MEDADADADVDVDAKIEDKADVDAADAKVRACDKQIEGEAEELDADDATAAVRLEEPLLAVHRLRVSSRSGA